MKHRWGDMCDDVESVQSSDIPPLDTSTLCSSSDDFLNSSSPKLTLTSPKNTSIKDLKMNLKEVICEEEQVRKELRRKRENFNKGMTKMMNEKEKFEREKREILENLESCLKERDSLKEDIATLKNDFKLLQDSLYDVNVECHEVKSLNKELSKKLKTFESQLLDSSAEHEKNKSRIATLERELNESTKCNEVLTAKLKKSENEYLGISKDLEHSNLRVHKLEQDLNASINNSVKEIDIVQKQSSSVPHSSFPKKKKVFICHHCGKKGHIRPFCHELLKNLGRGIHFRDKGHFNHKRPTQILPVPQYKAKNVIGRQKWVRKCTGSIDFLSSPDSCHSYSSLSSTRENLISVSSNTILGHNTSKAKYVWNPKSSNEIERAHV